MRCYELFEAIPINQRRAAKQGFTVDAYHGTSADFDRFENKGFAQLGYHFGATPDQAHSRAIANGQDEPAGQRILPVKLRLKNPLRIHDMEDWSAASVLWGLQYSGDMSPPLAALVRQLRTAFHDMDFAARAAAIEAVGDLYRQHNWSQSRWGENQPPPEAEEMERAVRAKHAIANEDTQVKMLVDGLKRLGYDGFVYNNRFEGDGDSYLVFDSNQIRGRFANFAPRKTASNRLMDGRAIP
jgi:hypothetical protein